MSTSLRPTRVRSRRRLRAAAALPLALGLAWSMTALSACSSSSDGAIPAQAAAMPTPAATEAVLIDVRTPEEFAAGHLDGAVNIDVQSADFSRRLTELDPDASYLVYCRSGNRSAVAVGIMRDAGFTDLADLGGLQEAADATGIDIVS